VATYGQVATVAGLPRHARLVGYALNILPPDTRVPWFRVLNARGLVSARSNALGHEELQVQLLRREGVRFVGDAVPLDRYGWRPTRAMSRRTGSVGRRAGTTGRSASTRRV
jgi:methylated-DNA-protein-cysteine methyltransferase-like protein